jgi:hypothetical protein
MNEKVKLKMDSSPQGMASSRDMKVLLESWIFYQEQVVGFR